MLLALLIPTQASQQLTGNYIQAAYDDEGVWNDTDSLGEGLEFDNTGAGTSFCDFTYPGTPWTHVQAEWDQSSSSEDYYVNSTYGATATAVSETDASTASEMVSIHEWTMGDLSVTKVEIWGVSDTIMSVNYIVTNNGTDDATDFRIIHAIDPDQDANSCTSSSSSYNTYNSVEDLDTDGNDDMVQSVGPYSDWTIGFYGCDSSDTYGHNSSWDRDADATLTDYAGASGDYAMYWRHDEATIVAGDTITFGFLVTMADNEADAQTNVLAASTCGSVDADGDGFISSSYGGDDCDDSDASTYPGAAELDSTTDCMTDVDGDGYGEESPATGVTAGTDCDDSDSSISPAGTETTGDGVDSDCDGTEVCWADDDGDSYGDASSTVSSSDTDCDDAGEADDDDDCDDASDTTYPGAAEYDSSTDCLSDADEDGYGDSSATGDVTAGTDCDDDDADIYPGATETVADGVDDDCDGGDTCYTDDDGDSYGDTDTVDSSDLDCTDAGEADDSEDCDDTDADAYPGSAELDSTTDCMADADGDGYGDDDPATGVTAGTDCDDSTSAAYPGADEYCDGIDNDCDDEIDEDDSLDVSTWYADTDTDSYGDPGVSDIDCDQPSGYVADNTDCDDTNPDAWPGATEIPYDGIDQDCDGSDWCDVDGDGYAAVECGGDDCDDSDAEIHPGATEIWYDGVDQDCDAWSDYDADGDGYDSASYGGEDCDDADDATYPGAPDEPYDGIINDCDDADEYDQDGDGYLGGDEGDDCDDANSDINPGATEDWYDGVDQDCDGNDDDQDGDGVPVDLDCDDEDPDVGEACDSGDTGLGGEYLGGTCQGCATGTPAGGLAALALMGLALLRRRRD